jgi:hypothetical protein
MITSSNPVLIDYTPLTRKRKIQDKIYSFPKNFKQYIFSLFPILQWIHRYNFSVSSSRPPKCADNVLNNITLHLHSGLFKMELQELQLVC